MVTGVEVRRDQLLVGLGAAGVAVHAVDHLASDPEWSFWFTAAVVLSGVTLGMATLWRRIVPSVRELGALGLGSMWAAVAFVHHVIGLFVAGPAPTDYTGIPATVGGVLIVVAGLDARAQRLRGRAASGAARA
jgi:hypothetical protein